MVEANERFSHIHISMAKKAHIITVAMMQPNHAFVPAIVFRCLIWMMTVGLIVAGVSPLDSILFHDNSYHQRLQRGLHDSLVSLSTANHPLVHTRTSTFVARCRSKCAACLGQWRMAQPVFTVHARRVDTAWSAFSLAWRQRGRRRIRADRSTRRMDHLASLAQSYGSSADNCTRLCSYAGCSDDLAP